jgi:CRP/FNR family nitrogen fixation transcriptional regulator
MAALDAGDERREPSHHVGSLPERRTVPERIVRNADEIICEPDSREAWWYRVDSGAARCCTHLVDGRRRVIEFMLPGDLFQAYTLPIHDVCIEAIVTPTRVARFSPPQLEQLARADHRVASDLCEAAPRAIVRLQTHAVMLGHGSAIGRIAGFLLEFARRSGVEDEETMALPMSRSDIADYLGLAVESVSRALTQLRREQVIELDGPKNVQILQRPRLEQLGAQMTPL